MRRFKTKVGRNEPAYKLTKENVERYCVPAKKYRIVTPQGIRYSAVCPECDNPIRIFGIDRKITRRNQDGTESDVRPYGKHHEQNTQVATYNPVTYRHCPYASGYRMSNKHDRYKELTKLNKEIYYSVRENFDSAIYILSKSVGFQISNATAKQMLVEYLGTQGYMYYDATYSNIPWMLWYQSYIEVNVWHLQVAPDSELYKFLASRKEVQLIPNEKNGKINSYTVENTGKYLDAMLELNIHKRTVNSDNEVEETLELRYIYKKSRNATEYSSKTITKITIDKFWYYNLIKSSNRKRNEKLMALAQELMPDIN